MSRRRSPLWLTVPGSFAAGASAAALAARWSPVGNHPVLILAALAPYLSMCSIAAIPLFLAAGRRWWALAAAFLLSASVAVQVPLFHPAGPPVPGSVTVRMLTANLHLGRAEPVGLVRLARDIADVVVVQEITPLAADRISSAGMDNHFPFRALDVRPGAGGTGVWSRHPISGSTRLPGYALSNLAVRIAVAGARSDTVVLAIHLAGPWPQAIGVWRGEIHALRASLAEASASAGSGAVIAAGDFNATHDMRPFRHLLELGFRDAVEQTGAGWARTFPADSFLPPLIGIDHILTLRSGATHAETVRVAGSDHLGLVARVHLPGVELTPPGHHDGAPPGPPTTPIAARRPGSDSAPG
jgi:endonuclease/exonuclease/phosphatase (EEP) superfamily protein YafD